MIDDRTFSTEEGKVLIDVIGDAGGNVPPVCYHARIGAIQPCDTCIFEVDATAERKQTVSFLSLVRRLTERYSLRALAAGIDFLQSFGRRHLARDTLSSADPS